MVEKMAGKTKRQVQAGQPASKKGAGPNKVKMPDSLMQGPLKGHLGLKSGPFSPTSAKLTSQYMILDHMSAHYRKVGNAKSAIDMTPPKAWLVSQKVRDQARREAVKHSVKRRTAWEGNNMRPASRLSDESATDRNDMYTMYQSFQDEDEVDAVNTTMEVHASDHARTEDMRMVERLVLDNKHSPSKYHSPRPARSNIPAAGSTMRITGRGARPVSAAHGNTSLNDTNTSQFSTPRENSADLLEKRAQNFTEQKPFTPRTLKKYKNVPSKLSQFKHYTAPKKSEQKPVSAKSAGPVMARPDTPMTNMTDSVDLMNETLMSRDMSHGKGSGRTPTGIPPLDISMDADHINWLKEQSRKADIRTRPQSAGHGSLLQQEDVPMTRTQGWETKTWNKSTDFIRSPTFVKVEEEEEELKYLEFVQEVTNDILETGVFTNRVLKKVFEKHIHKRRHELKQSRMRELLQDLREDLGIPADDAQDEEGAGFASTLTSQDFNNTLRTTGTMNNTLGVDEEDEMHDTVPSLGMTDSHRRRRSPSPPRKGTFNPMMTTQRLDLTKVRLPKQVDESSAAGKPPLPKPRSRGGSKGGVDSSDEFTHSNLRMSVESTGSFDGLHSDKPMKTVGFVNGESDQLTPSPKARSPKGKPSLLSPQQQAEVESEKDLSSVHVSELDEDELDDF